MVFYNETKISNQNVNLINNMWMLNYLTCKCHHVTCSLWILVTCIYNYLCVPWIGLIWHLKVMLYMFYLHFLFLSESGVDPRSFMDPSDEQSVLYEEFSCLALPHFLFPRQIRHVSIRPWSVQGKENSR